MGGLIDTQMIQVRAHSMEGSRKFLQLEKKMNPRGKTLFFLILSVLYISACSATPTPIPPTLTTIPPTPTPIPEPGIGVPVGNEAWQVSLNAVRTANLLKFGIEHYDQVTATPNEGYAFLILDVVIKSLDPTRAIEISRDHVAILDADKTIHTADGGGWNETSMCAGCAITFSSGIGDDDMTVFAVAESTFSFGFITRESPLSFVFVVTAEELNQEWQLQFQDIPPISFKLGDQTAHSLKTEVMAQDSPLPQECQANAIQLATEKTGFIYQEWEDNQLLHRIAFPDEGTPIELCKGLAYGTVQMIPDGGMLLMAGPMRGWANLYMIEPNGEVTSLVNNALSVNGAFIPDTHYVLVSVTRLEKEGEELYLFDRENGEMTLLYEGAWIHEYVFPNGALLVEGESRETSEQFTYMGTVGAEDLPVFALPEGTHASNISPDGNFLIRPSDSEHPLLVMDINGATQNTLDGYDDGILSPDGKYMVLEKEVTNKNQAYLYDLTTDSSQQITPESDKLEYSFSSDNKWVVAISSVTRKENDETKTEQTLYLFSIADQKVVKEIKGNIVNYFFSPDNAFLAYTMMNEDETLSILILALADLSEQLIGPGILAGWSTGQ